MPRYFYHIHDGGVTIDHQGINLENPDAARNRAIISATDRLAASASTFWDIENWTLHVKDEVGRTVCILKLSGVSGQP